MKKIILVLFCFLLFKSYGADYSSFCSSKIPDKNFIGNVSSLSGVNFLARRVIEHEIISGIKEKTNSKFDVDIDSYYGTSLTDGIFKNLSIEGNNFTYDDLKIAHLYADTPCSYNHIQYKDKRLYYIENFVLNYELEIAEKDLNDYVSSTKYQQLVNKINNDKFLSSLVKIDNIKIELKEDKMYMTYKVTPLPTKSGVMSVLNNTIKPFSVKLGANLKVEDNKIKLSDVDMNSVKVNFNLFQPLVNALNPKEYKVKLDKYNEGELKLDDIKIKFSKIIIKGAILVQGENNKNNGN